jgi:pyridoxine/pyridoxamine 5'-phosphate oxidase
MSLPLSSNWLIDKSEFSTSGMYNMLQRLCQIVWLLTTKFTVTVPQTTAFTGFALTPHTVEFWVVPESRNYYNGMRHMYLMNMQYQIMHCL